MRESTAYLEVPRALGYVGELDANLRARTRHATGTLVRVVDGPR